MLCGPDRALCLRLSGGSQCLRCVDSNGILPHLRSLLRRSQCSGTRQHRCHWGSVHRCRIFRLWQHPDTSRLDTGCQRHGRGLGRVVGADIGCTCGGGGCDRPRWRRCATTECCVFRDTRDLRPIMAVHRCQCAPPCDHSSCRRVPSSRSMVSSGWSDAYVCRQHDRCLDHPDRWGGGHSWEPRVSGIPGIKHTVGRRRCV